MKFTILDDPRYNHLAKPRTVLFQIFSFIFDLYANSMLLFYARVKIIGKENIPKDTPFIFVSNHNSHMDIAVLAFSTKMGYEKFGFLAAKDYWFDNTFNRILFKNFINLIPISRNTSGKDSIDIEDTFLLTKAFMSLNNNIIMFPEGSRGEAGQLQRFRKGAMRFSMGLNVPVLPAAIIGTEKVWPKGEWFMKPGKITIKILPPIYPKDSTQMSEQEINKEISSKTSELQQIVEQGLAELTS